MKWIGRRISFVDHEAKTTIIITPDTPGIFKGLIGAWVFMWGAVGAYLIWYLIESYGKTKLTAKQLSTLQQEQIIIVVFLVFWIYYFVRIGRVFLWLNWGREYIKIDKIALTLKPSIGKYGRAKEYFIENISKISVFTPEKNSLQAAWENSPWIRGGERVEFEYFGKRVRFGRKLEEQDAKQLFQLVTKKIDEHLKRKKKQS